ncbi:MAG TPA: hypothetical protein VGM87_07210 [Roseomonas sp.]
MPGVVSDVAGLGVDIIGCVVGATPGTPGIGTGAVVPVWVCVGDSRGAIFGGPACCATATPPNSITPRHVNTDVRPMECNIVFLHRSWRPFDHHSTAMNTGTGARFPAQLATSRANRAARRTFLLGRIGMMLNSDLKDPREQGRALGRQRNIKRATRLADALRSTIDDIRRDGATSYHQIAAELNRRGVRAPRGGQWFPIQVRRIVQRINTSQTA